MGSECIWASLPFFSPCLARSLSLSSISVGWRQAGRKTGRQGSHRQPPPPARRSAARRPAATASAAAAAAGRRRGVFVHRRTVPPCFCAAAAALCFGPGRLAITSLTAAADRGARPGQGRLRGGCDGVLSAGREGQELSAKSGSSRSSNPALQQASRVLDLPSHALKCSPRARTQRPPALLQPVRPVRRRT